MSRKDFNPIVKVVSEGLKSPTLSYIIEGTAKVLIEDLCGCDFFNEETKNQFISDVEEFKKALKNYPEDFNGDDRIEIERFVYDLLVSYFNEGKIIEI